MQENFYTLRSIVAEKISHVSDPELNISLTELGLIYNISFEDKKAIVEMTLTSMGCPLFSVMENDIKDACTSIDGIDEAEIKLVFDPPWDMRMVSPNAQAELGIA
jgi:metal-sulfur cluster biosynthetic enzyme